MKKFVLLILIIVFPVLGCSSEVDTLKLSSNNIEKLFIEQNLQIIAERFNIDLSEAAIVQAKLWDNPEIAIGQINLWTTNKQREGESEVIPPLFGSFARNTQFTVELSQLIQTAGKRSKLIKKEKIARDIAIQDFENLLRGLRIELRKSINEMIYLQDYYGVLNHQTQALEYLIASYEKQMKQGNIAKSELLRLQSSLIDIENEKNETQIGINEQQKNLKILLNVPVNLFIELENTTQTLHNPDDLSLTNLLEVALESRPDLKNLRLQMQLHEKSLAYEKAQRVPDVTLSANYDRVGGVWKNFVGFGISFDLPIFNRNQGNIRAASIQLNQSMRLAEFEQKKVQDEVFEALSNYIVSYKFYKRMADNALLSELDDMLAIYTKNLLNKNVSMLEFTDFIDSYKTNKETLLSALKKVNIQFDELQYTIGKDIK